jgi:HD-GYP domain-containing protein (c-di-GMP phosphodiesterase class II)
VRLAEVLGALSLATDAADGFRPEKAARTCVLAMGLADLCGVGEREDVYYGSLLRFLGCTGFAHEEAHRYGAGDDVGLRAVMGLGGGRPSTDVRRIVTGIGRGRPAAERVRAVATLLGDRTAVRAHAEAQCDAAEHLGRQLVASPGVLRALAEAFERWDGRGHPRGTGGTDLGAVTRVIQVADVADLYWCVGGPAAAVGEVRRRAGGHLDPAVAEAFAASAPDLLAPLAGGSVWDVLLDLEPQPVRTVSPAGLDRVAIAFARYADLRSVWTLGHSERVADAAGDDPRLRLAALLHDLGRVAIPAGVWDKPGPLNAAEWEQVRLHSYHTERILRTAPLLADVASLAGAAHERLDGSGYHKGLPAGLLSAEARLLAAADVWVALRSDRPHRPARPAAEAAAVLAAEAAAGRLDPAAVRGVLERAGGGAPAPAVWPAGLTDREVEVLRLVARGATNKDVARALGITPRTVAHHVEHVYGKVGCTSRAGAALFAVEHGLVGPWAT